MLEWLEGLPPALFLQRTPLAYLLTNAAHIATFGLLLGSIIALDLRLLGMGRDASVATLGRFLSSVAAGGLVLSTLTGILLFMVNPSYYAQNPAFLIKLALVAVGVVNALWLHARPYWAATLSGPEVPLATRLHALASLVIWLAAVVAGRWIGFLE